MSDQSTTTTAGHAPRTLEQIVGEAVGHASVCWDPAPEGVFDEAQASAVVDGVLDELRTHIWAFAGIPTEPYLGLATTAQLLDELRARAEVGGYAGYRTVDGS